MNKARKKLNAALKHTDELPENWFGVEEASIEDLPSIQRNRRIRKNIYIEEKTVNALEHFCEQHKTSFTDIANDILTKFVKNQKEKARP